MQLALFSSTFLTLKNTPLYIIARLMEISVAMCMSIVLCNIHIDLPSCNGYISSNDKIGRSRSQPRYSTPPLRDDLTVSFEAGADTSMSQSITFVIKFRSHELSASNISEGCVTWATRTPNRIRKSISTH